MSADPLAVFVGYQIDRTELRAFQEEVNKLERDSENTFAKVRQAAITMGRILINVVNLTKRILKFMGKSLDPMHEVLLNAIVSSTTALISIGVAWNALPFVGTVIYAAIVAAATSMSIAASVRVASDRNFSRRKTDEAIGVLSSAGALMGSMRFG